jgi:hypothetical protein
VHGQILRFDIQSTEKDGYRGFWDVKSHESRDALILYLEDIILSYKRSVSVCAKHLIWQDFLKRRLTIQAKIFAVEL